MIPFRTILLAADFSESSLEAFRVACALARAHGTRVHVLNVLEPNYVPDSPVYFGRQTIHYRATDRDPSEHEAQGQRLREIYFTEQPFDVDYQTAQGEIANEIVRAVDEVGADLVVMGTHGRGGLNRLLAGSIAETVLRKARCPVLALRHYETARRGTPLRVILHATDFSDCSEASLHVARLLARDAGARLVLHHVTPLDVALEGSRKGGGDPVAERAHLEVIRRQMEGPDLKCPVEARLGRGEPAAEILRAADEVGADLIVMGTHGRGGLGRVLMGSVAESVLREAPCPVLIARSAAPEPGAGQADDERSRALQPSDRS
jgi:nucleotide-binding universal stress UspA family protein